MGPAGRLLGIDRDPDALRLAADRLAAFGDQVRLVHANFAELGEIVTQSGWGPSDAVVYDFSLSSMHADRPERGFSYQHDAPLDMRMDPTAAPSAYDIVNTYDEQRLSREI